MSVGSAKVARPHGATFSEGDWMLLAQHWFPVAASDSLADGPAGTQLLDVGLVVFSLGGRPIVALDRCPHRGMPLSRGWVDGGALVCPYHGLHFAADGRCTAIPSDPQATISDRLSLVTLPTVERYGLIWTSLHGQAPKLPDFEAWEDAAFQGILPPVVDIGGSIGRQVEGFLDVAHFAWVHTDSFGQRDNPLVADYPVEPTEHGLRMTYRSDVSNYGPAQRHLEPEGFVWTRVFDVFLPFAARLVVHFPRGGQLCILNAPSPLSARRTRLFSPIARNFEQDGPVEAVHAFNLRVFEEDRAMVEAQRPLDLPLDLSEEVHIAADRASVAYRRLLRQMGLSLAAQPV